MNKVIGIVLVSLIACAVGVFPLPAFSEVNENSWVSKASMQQARSGLGVATVNGRIYAIGGSVLVYQNPLRTESTKVGLNEEYDPATNTWSSKKPMPAACSDFATAVYAGKIYCISEGKNEVYDPVTDTWEIKTPMPLPQTSAQAHVTDGKIFVMGGFPNGTLNQVYDPTTDIWTIKASMPIDPIGSSVLVNDKIYAVGSDLKWRIYNPETDNWSIGPDFPIRTFNVEYMVSTTGLMAPERIYVFYNPSDAPNGFVYANQVYDPASNSWIAGANIPTERSGFSVAVVDDLIYVIGGLKVTYPNIESWSTGGDLTEYRIVEQYTPFGYGSVPPAISLASPQNMANFTSTDIPLNFTINKPTAWISYSLDGKDNVSVTANTTLTGLSAGWHNVTVYAKDMNGNVGASETITFSVDSTPIQIAAIVLIVCVSAAAVFAASILYYRKKHRG